MERLKSKAGVHFEELDTFRQEPEKRFPIIIVADYQQSNMFCGIWITDQRLNV